MRHADILPHLSIAPLTILGALLAILLIAALGLPFVRHRDGGAITAFAAGMGIMTLTFTVVGTLSGIDFRIVSLGLLAVAVVAVIAVRGRGDVLDITSNAVYTVLAVGVLIFLVSSRVASEWDEFSHWLHAVRYLSEAHVFPGPVDHPPIQSCCAAYPYGWPLLAYLAHHVSGFSEATTAVANIILLGLFGALLADIIHPGCRRQPFVIVTIGVIGATLLGPTFVSKLVFSNYADNVTNVLIGATAFLVYRLGLYVRDGDRRAAICMAVAIGLAGAAILNVKPANLVLFVFVLAGGALLYLRDKTWRFSDVCLVFGVLMFPAAIYLLWRMFVGDNLQGQEMSVRAFADWQLDLIPGTLAAMFGVASKKGGYFVLMLVIVALGIRGLWRNRTEVDRLAVIVATLFVSYNAFLLFAYIAIFGEFDALRAASYWRYNTHLGLSSTLVAAAVVGELWRRYVLPRTWSRSRILTVLPILVLLVAPIAALKSIRFDVDPTKTFMRETLRSITINLPHGAGVGIYDPQGSGLAAVMATYEWADYASVTTRISAFNNPAQQTVAQLQKNAETDYILVLSGHDRSDLIPDAPNIYVLARDGDWASVSAYPYPEGRFPARFP